MVSMSKNGQKLFSAFWTCPLVLEVKTGKEIPESSRFEFLEKFSANNFALSDAEDNTSRSMNRVGIADLHLWLKNN